MRRTLLIPETWTTTLTLGYVAFYLADYFVLSGVFVDCHRTPRALRHGGSPVLHQAATATIISLRSFPSSWCLPPRCSPWTALFLLAFAAFMLMAVVTFILMEMRRASAQATVRANSSSDDSAYRKMAFSLAGASPVLVFLIMLGAAGIFFVLPRISSGYLSAYARSSEISTGFSDQVQLGQIGEIQQSNSLVMHIQIDGDPHGAYDLKWRGVTLNVFDGKTWSNPRAQHVVTQHG